MTCWGNGIGTSACAGEWRSHPPIRPMPNVGERPLGADPHYFVDPLRGDDAAEGSLAHPWRTINASLERLKPGDTLVLREGIYFENVYCAVAGTAEKPITIRSYPGERAIIDGGMETFQADPAAAWEPYADGGEGEYVSTRTYRNVRDVVGLFADSNIGLQTYWDLESFRASDDFDSPRYPERAPGEAINGYCGPGLWYDKLSGRIHVRLAHTHLPQLDTYNYEQANYTGETDPRRLPLVVARFDSVPLHVDQAMHVRFQDLVVRGGGYRTVWLNFGIDIEFDRCAFYGGTYVVWAKGTGPLKMTHCGVHGMIAPWMFRSENILSVYSPHEYPPFLPDTEGKRHISRLPTHAVLVTEGGHEFDTFYYPHNHHWDISYCEFTDGHDGPYLSGYEIRFHHNWVDRMQDDGVYISSPTPYFTRSVHIYNNYLSAGISAIGAHGRGGPGGDIFIYRNVMDLRRPMQTNRPTPQNPKGTFWFGHSVYFRHGQYLMGENLHFYQNTLLIGGHAYAGSMWDAGARSKARVFNNMILYREAYPSRWPKTGAEQGHDIQMDGNLHWSLQDETNVPADFLARMRSARPSKDEKNTDYAGWELHSLAADPKLHDLSADWRQVNDYRLRTESPAIGKGVVLPEEYEDPLKPEGDAPDIGALPLGTEPLRVGIDGRVTAGDLRVPE